MTPTIIDPPLERTSHSKVDMDTSQSLPSKPRIRVTVPLLSIILTLVGKIEKENVYKPKNHVPSKIERRNTQKQVQKNKKEEHVRNARFFGGARGAAKIVVSVPQITIPEICRL